MANGFGLGDSCFDPNKFPAVELPNLVGCPKSEVPGAGEGAKPNRPGAGVVVGVVDSGVP